MFARLFLTINSYSIAVEEILDRVIAANIPIVVSGGNTELDSSSKPRGVATDDYLPANYLKGKPGAIIAAASDRCGLMLPEAGRFRDTNDVHTHMVFAPGKLITIASIRNMGYTTRTGASAAAARLAGLVAYLRGLNSPWADQLSTGDGVKKMITKLQKVTTPTDGNCANPPPPNSVVRVAWNGQVPDDSDSNSCLHIPVLSYKKLFNACPCPFDSQFPLRRSKREDEEEDDEGDGTSCPLPGSGNGGGGGHLGELPVPGPIEWNEGEPSPTCTTNCGNACDGFWCTPKPTGTPPDYDDPDPTTTQEPEPSSTSTDPSDPTPTQPTYPKPDPSKNVKSCYNSGQTAEYDAITFAAESFCHNLADDPRGPIIHGEGFNLTKKKTPHAGYHFILMFELYKECEWELNYDECMRYMKVPIDSCNCAQQGEKQGGRVTNNCISARLDPNYGA